MKHLTSGMNFLAHAYLSFDDPAILFGNMIADFVKGKKQYDYPIEIQRGIKLHRSIDTFTDDHLITREMKKIFRPSYGLYAGVFTDIAYDYFLANDENIFNSIESLAQFSNNTYIQLHQQIDEAPPVFQQLFPYMRTNDWLYNYRYDEGINRGFSGIVRRAKYINESDTAFKLFLNNKNEIRSLYNAFFPMLKNHAAEYLRSLLNAD